MNASPPQTPAPRSRNRRILLVTVVVACIVGVVVARRTLFESARQNLLETNDQSVLTREGRNAPFIVSPDPVVAQMVAVAQVKPEELVYDLGCGDGRIVIAAARQSGCTGVGYDIDPKCVKLAQESARQQEVADRVEFVVQDVFTVDMRKVDVTFLYLLPWMINKLIPQLEQMKPGGRIVCHEFWLPGFEPDLVVVLDSAGTNENPTIYRYTTPLRKNPALRDGRPPRPADYPPQKQPTENTGAARQ